MNHSKGATFTNRLVNLPPNLRTFVYLGSLVAPAHFFTFTYTANSSYQCIRHRGCIATAVASGPNKRGSFSSLRSHPATMRVARWSVAIIPSRGRTRSASPLHKSSVAQTDPVMNARCPPTYYIIDRKSSCSRRDATRRSAANSIKSR